MGKFYAVGGPEEPVAVGINLVNTTTGVHLFCWRDNVYFSVVLNPAQAERLADELHVVAGYVREDNK